MRDMRFLAAVFVTLLCPSASHGDVVEPGTPVPSPTVTGPIASAAAPGDPSRAYPFLSTPVDLASRGYVEEEFFFEGAARRFDIPAALTVANTPQTTAAVIEGAVPYRTRMIVRRPASPLKFNGIVVMEWQNVSFGFDADLVWLGSNEHLMRRGYAWIGVSPQRVGVNGPRGLSAWNPLRYGTLDVTAGGTILNDALSFDIFSQAAQAVRQPQGDDPMGGLPIKSVIAVGVSQGAVYLVAYQNAVHPLAHVFDGFMPFVHGSTVRADSDAKAFKVLTETDVAREQATLRQPNSDRFRRWEVAGAAHMPLRVAEAMIPLMARDLGSPLPGSCTLTPFSRVPWDYVLNASLDAMVDWVNDGIEPPVAPDIEVAATGLPGFFTADVARDGLGNALGGIRLAEHAVPTATNTGLNFPTTSACRTYGSYQPFDQATLAALYPDHGTYVSQVAQVTQGNTAARYIVREDAMATIEAAVRSGVGKRQ